MATVLERCNELGLKHDKALRSFVGESVAEVYRTENPLDGVDRKPQTEGEYTFEVNDYPRYWQDRMDYVIILACAEHYKKANG